LLQIEKNTPVNDSRYSIRPTFWPGYTIFDISLQNDIKRLVKKKPRTSVTRIEREICLFAENTLFLATDSAMAGTRAIASAAVSIDGNDMTGDAIPVNLPYSTNASFGGQAENCKTLRNQ
jgi:hypothetical protein